MKIKLTLFVSACIACFFAGLGQQKNDSSTSHLSSLSNNDMANTASGNDNKLTILTPKIADNNLNAFDYKATHLQKRIEQKSIEALTAFQQQKLK